MGRATAVSTWRLWSIASACCQPNPQTRVRAWYKLFKQCDAEPEIAQAHQSYLFARDYATIGLVFLVCAGSLSFVVLPDIKTKLAYLGFLMVQCLVVCLSARHHGTRMVTNTLALHSRK